MASNLGPHLGWRGFSGEARKARLQAWVDAGRAARRNPQLRCEAIANMTGERCLMPGLRGHRFCRHHLRGPDRIAADAEREGRYRRILERGDIPSRMDKARRGLAAIARTRLRALWRKDPRAPGSTLELSEIDEAKVIAFLRENCHLDVTRPLPETGRALTPRSLDRVRHSAWRAVKRQTSGTMSQGFFARIRDCVAAVRQDEIKFWAKWVALGGEDNAEK